MGFFGCGRCLRNRVSCEGRVASYRTLHPASHIPQLISRNKGNTMTNTPSHSHHPRSAGRAAGRGLYLGGANPSCAGPHRGPGWGDPGLLTVTAGRALTQAAEADRRRAAGEDGAAVGHPPGHQRCALHRGHPHHRRQPDFGRLCAPFTARRRCASEHAGSIASRERPTRIEYAHGIQHPEPRLFHHPQPLRFSPATRLTAGRPVAPRRNGDINGRGTRLARTRAAACASPRFRPVHRDQKTEAFVRAHLIAKALIV